MPVVEEGTVIDLDPVAGAANPLVSIRGVDARTGAILWAYTGRILVLDYPSACAGAGDICVAVSTNLSSSTLLILDAVTGQTIRRVAGVAREMDDKGLYQTTARAPTLEQLGIGGTLRWQRTVASLFGPGSTPNTGWNFDQRGNVVVGAVGVTPTGVNMSTGTIAPGGATENLGRLTSAGIDVATGALAWRARGSYQCEGLLEVLRTPLLCRLTGSIHFTSPTSRGTMEGVTLVLEGLNPRPGAVTWHIRVLDVQPFLGKGAVPFLDASHLVVRTEAGLQVLDTVTGATSPVSPSTTFWCETTGSYHVVPYPGDNTHGYHTAAPAFAGCTASGAHVAAVPASRPTTVGVRASGRFVWLSPKGIRSTGKARAVVT